MEGAFQLVAGEASAEDLAKGSTRAGLTIWEKE